MAMAMKINCKAINNLRKFYKNNINDCYVKNVKTRKYLPVSYEYALMLRTHYFVNPKFHEVVLP